ncbi:hypothetical protein B6U66_03090 [Candidatus Bathyarchaeota archaeon ex4484_135]|nr:MAG: hypothetical protein B6U66_03090 [Candidatus Bathyarchaeota archaeon ex4484_135]
MGLKLPLGQRTRELIKKYLAGEPLEPKEHMTLYKIRRKLAETDLELIEADLKLLKAFQARPFRTKAASS